MHSPESDKKVFYQKSFRYSTKNHDCGKDNRKRLPHPRPSRGIGRAAAFGEGADLNLFPICKTHSFFAENGIY
jgi:hypothetical protein